MYYFFPFVILLGGANVCLGAPSESLQKSSLRIKASTIIIPATTSFSQSISAEFQLGTPFSGEEPQLFNLILDSVGSATYVFDANDCKEDWCNTMRKFNTSASSTYKKLENFKNQYNEIGTDILSIGDIKVEEQRFGIANTDIMKGKDTTQLANGILSLVYEPSGSELEWKPTPFQNYFDKMDDKIVSVWVENSPGLSGSAQLTLGAKDSEHCKNDWKFTDVVVTKELDKGLWTVSLDGFQIVDKQLQNFTELGQNVAVINTMDSAIIGPEEYLKEIIDAFKGEKLGSCKREGLPDLKLFIGAKEYIVTPQQYIIDYQPNEDKCILGVQTWNSKNRLENMQIDERSTWSLGHAFLRSYCTTLDYSERKRIGFAVSLNSASASTIPIMVILLSVLMTFAQKINKF